MRLHHEAGYSVREIAAMLMLPESSVKVGLLRARKRLRHILIAMLLMLLLLAAAAFAARQFNVSFFFTERVAEPRAEESLDQSSLPFEQRACDLRYLDAHVTSAAWIDWRVAVTVEFSVKDPANHVALPREALGVDGERHDHV